MNMQMEKFHTNDRAPEVACQKRDIEECSRGKTEQDRCTAVENQKTERVSGQVATQFTIVPDRGFVLRPVENAGHGAVDEHAPEAELAYHFVQWAFRDEELFSDIAHAVEGCAYQCEEVAFQLIPTSYPTEAGSLCDSV